MQQSLCDLVNECVRIIRNKPTDQVLREETDAFHKSNPLQSVIVNTKNLMEPCRRERSAMVPVEQIPENRLEGTLVINQLKNVIAFHKERQKKIKEEKVRLLWNSMSRQEKQSLLRLNMNELLAHFHSSSNNSASKLIKEAFWFAKDHNNWKVWICSSCDMKFVDSELHFQHVMEAHLGRFSQVLQSVLPSRLNSDWQWLICKGTWKPVDPSAALLILTEHSKGFTTRSHIPDEIDYHTDKSPQKHTRGPLTNEVCSDRGSLFVSGRPMSDYSHRSDLLERIRQMLEYLLRAGYLDANHVDKIKQYTMKRLGALYPGLKLSDNQLGQTHICICFLGASQLEEIVKFLDKLSQFAFMLIDHKKSTIAKFLNTHHMGLENKWRIVLNGDSLCLLVGENSLCGESAPKIYTDDDASKAFIPDSGINDIEPPITDVLLRWLFTGPSSEEELKMWLDLDELRKTQEKELHQIIARNGPILFMCDKKYKRLRYREALQAIWRLLFNELTERQLTSNRAHKSFETILSMQQQQLVEESESDISKTKKFTLEVIQNVLNDAQSLGFTYQTVLTSVATYVCDLDIFDNGDLAVQIFLDQADTCIKEVMKKHGNNMELQLMKLESWIMDTVKETEKVRVTINPSAAADYREILWPLAKSCILAKLEEHLEKDETEINKVADKGNVSQAAPKSKKRDNRGGQSKPPQKKPKNSEAKSSESNVQLIVLDQETDE